VEHRDATQGTRVPFFEVFREFRIDGFHKGTHERDLESRTCDASLVPYVLDYTAIQQPLSANDLTLHYSRDITSFAMTYLDRM
jgi:hypothetical protein